MGPSDDLNLFAGVGEGQALWAVGGCLNGLEQFSSVSSFVCLFLRPVCNCQMENCLPSVVVVLN